MISYAHADGDLCAELKTWLVSFERESRARFWSDHAIDAGEQWHPAILDALRAADVVLLLLSPPFFASTFIHDQELPLIKARRDAGALTVVPIRLRPHYSPASETYAWLRDEQQVPRDSRVVTCKTQRDKRDRDDAWHEVTNELARTLTRIEEQRSAGIVNRSAVDSEIAELRAGALARAREVVLQVPDDLGGIARAEVEAALAQAARALEADPLAFADQVASSLNRLRRCRIPPTEHAALSAALDAARGRLADLFETAREAGFPSSATVGVPAARTVPQAQIADVRAEVEARLDELVAKVDALAAQREGTPEAAATDAAIAEVVEDVKGQAGVARDLLAEPQVDMAGVTAAVEGAARAAGRFVRRVAGVASAALHAAADGITAAATVLVRAGTAFAAAARGEVPVVEAREEPGPEPPVPAEVVPPVEPAPASGSIPIVVRTAKGTETIHCVPGAGVVFRETFEVRRAGLFGRTTQIVQGPELVVVPAGSFLMGSTPEEIAALKKQYSGWDYGCEGPRHEVTIAQPFAVGRYAVTVGEFAAFVDATKRAMPDEMYTYEDGKWEARRGRSFRNPGFAQTDRDPVVGVDWEDATAYCTWLSRVTGQTYRLLSEAEWEYACRAGTTTAFHFGETISTDQANYDGNDTYGPGGKKGVYRQKTIEVGSLNAPNAWGLHDMHGNTWDWCMDNWHGTYAGAPSDGSAWISGGDTSLRVVRGGSWDFIPQDLRAANRFRLAVGSRGSLFGFRVARPVSSPRTF